MLAAPDVERDLGASYALTALALLVVPGVLGLVLEAPLLVLADRYPRRWFIAGGVIAMGTCGLVAAAAPSLAVFSAALALSGVASGIGVTLAEASLVDARPDEVERVMTRWSLLGMAGDLAAPLVFGGLIAVGGSWRLAIAAASGFVILYGLALTRVSFPSPRTDGDHPPTPFRQALRKPWLMVWVFAEGLCDLLDETLVVFASLRLRDELGASPVEQSAVLGCFVVGGAVGLVLLDRLLRTANPVRILVGSATLCAGFYAAWLATTSLAAGAALLFAVGATAAPLFPLCSAIEYRLLPGASGTVNALGNVFAPIGIATPLALGWLAESYGIDAALTALLVEPIVIGMVAASYLRAGR